MATSISRLQRINGRNLRSSGGRRQRGNNWMRYPLLILLVFVVGSASYLYYLWASPVGRNKETVYLFIRPETTMSALTEQINKKVWPRDNHFFTFLASWYKIQDNLIPGRYAVTPEMTASELLRNLREGKQSPITLLIGGLRTDEEIIDFFASSLMPRRDALASAYASQSLLDSLGLNRENFRSIFLTGRYEVNWNIQPQELYSQFARAYKAYWTKERREEAATIGLQPAEVITLASIIQSESDKEDEYARIAGLYLNRLRIGLKLQSDPTVKFALRQFDLRRIFKEHLSVPSPYNTYYSLGLPPGPIVLPRKATIEAVLHREENNYLFMCARETFDGYHNFTARYAEHLLNAQRYQEALNKRGIK